MSQENVDRVRRAWEAYEGGDLSAVLETLSPDLVTHVAPPIPLAGTYHGPEGLLQLTLDWAEGFDELIATAEEHIDAGDQVITRVRHRASGAESGVPVETDIWYVWTLGAEQTVRVDIFNDRREALEAAGLRE
ncbi:MAG: nuclear transport factor 2 family protein [Actinomycetota bacterium]|jgi:ketosteroid isomerase-like protein